MHNIIKFYQTLLYEFQELFELAQRKFISQLLRFTTNLSEYPRLFVIDIADNKVCTIKAVSSSSSELETALVLSAYYSC